MTIKGDVTRRKAIGVLQECHRRGDCIKETLKALSKRIDMGIPAARQVRNFLIREGYVVGELY